MVVRTQSCRTTCHTPRVVLSSVELPCIRHMQIGEEHVVQQLLPGVLSWFSPDDLLSGTTLQCQAGSKVGF